MDISVADILKSITRERHPLASDAAAVEMRQIVLWQVSALAQRTHKAAALPAVDDAVAEALQWRQTRLQTIHHVQAQCTWSEHACKCWSLVQMCILWMIIWYHVITHIWLVLIRGFASYYFETVIQGNVRWLRKVVVPGSCRAGKTLHQWTAVQWKLFQVRGLKPNGHWT